MECPARCCGEAFYPKCQPLKLKAKRKDGIEEKVADGVHARLMISAGATVSGIIHGKNSLWQYGQGQPMGVPPLRAIEFRE